MDNIYEKAGVRDVKEFYAEKFAFQADMDFTRDPLNFFTADYYKYLWFFSQIKPGSRVLDFGCGSGALACLKHKGCEVTGIDYSATALEVASRVNGYAYVFCGDIHDFDKHEYFDFVVSLDVFGHIPFEEKDEIIRCLKTFLKPGGIMLHGIECADVDYSAMTDEELSHFVNVDGHVGCEGKQANIKRFGRFFKHVEAEVRYDIVNSVGEFEKQIQEYGADLGYVLKRYFKHMSAEEKRAFNISSGLTLRKLDEHKYISPEDAGGCLFLRASDKSLPPYSLASPEDNLFEEGDLTLLDKVCVRGWYPVEKHNETSFRWSAQRPMISLEGIVGDELQMHIFSSYPRINEKPVDVYFLSPDDKELIKRVTLKDHDPVCVNFNLQDLNSRQLEIFVDIVWMPKLHSENEDRREIGIGVKDVIVF